MKRVILIAYGEIFLKGKNRPFFLKKLRNLIKSAIKIDESAVVTMTDGRYYVTDYNIDMEDEILDKISKIFGIHSYTTAYEVEKDADAIGQASIEIMKPLITRDITFKVYTKRADKRFPIRSMDMSANLGGVLLDEFKQLKVDINNPELTLYVEVRKESAYVYTNKTPGLGGMPVGSGGKAMLLLSGGIDSPVAAYMLAKRGLQIEAVHFYSPPYTSERAKQKVIDLAGLVKDYCGPVNLHIVPFTEIQEMIYEKCHHELLTIIMRRFMMRISERVAQNNKCEALATGESLGQVASQTLQSLHATNESIDMLVMRPLLCLDKIEIIRIAEKINTYETSIQPFEDCCTVFTPKHPSTKPKIKSLEINEAKLEVEELIQKAVDGIETILIK